MQLRNSFPKSITLPAKIARMAFIFPFILVATPQSVYASPAQQIDKARTFDATIIAQSYVRGARDCRTNELIDLSDGNFGQRFQVGPTCHFQNLWIYKGDPGQLFAMLSVSRGHSWEISSSPSAPAPVAPPGVNFSVDQNKRVIAENTM